MLTTLWNGRMCLFTTLCIRAFREDSRGGFLKEKYFKSLRKTRCICDWFIFLHCSQIKMKNKLNYPIHPLDVCRWEKPCHFGTADTVPYPSWKHFAKAFLVAIVHRAKNESTYVIMKFCSFSLLKSLLYSTWSTLWCALSAAMNEHIDKFMWFRTTQQSYWSMIWSASSSQYWSLLSEPKRQISGNHESPLLIESFQHTSKRSLTKPKLHKIHQRNMSCIDDNTETSLSFSIRSYKNLLGRNWGDDVGASGSERWGERGEGAIRSCNKYSEICSYRISQ